MQHDQAQLSQYRMDRAREDIATAKVNIENGLYKGAVNRSYYAIFHAIRAVNILDGFDASKHSAYRIREKCDYSDFFIVSKEEAEEQYNRAIEFVECVENFLSTFDNSL